MLQADATLGRTLELVVGTSYTGAHTVSVTGTPATANPTAGTSTAAAPLKTAAVNACTT